MLDIMENRIRVAVSMYDRCRVFRVARCMSKESGRKEGAGRREAGAGGAGGP